MIETPRPPIMERRHYLTILQEHEGPTWDTLEAQMLTPDQLKQILAILAVKNTVEIEPGGL